jgi:hypothetical protein
MPQRLGPGVRGQAREKTAKRAARAAQTMSCGLKRLANAASLSMCRMSPPNHA